MKVPARKVDNFDSCSRPGDFFLTASDPEKGGCRRLSFLCPCGCGDLCGVRIRDDGQQSTAVWGWDQNEQQPTLTPSIRIGGAGGAEHWHGYLTKGVFTSC